MAYCILSHTFAVQVIGTFTPDSVRLVEGRKNFVQLLSDSNERCSFAEFFQLRCPNVSARGTNAA